MPSQQGKRLFERETNEKISKELRNMGKMTKLAGIQGLRFSSYFSVPDHLGGSRFKFLSHANNPTLTLKDTVEYRGD